MRRLLIFLKDPIPGQVKTRLAAALGDRAACEVYRACTELALKRLKAFRDEAILCIDPPEALARTRERLGPGWRLRPQHGTTLGERLAEATDHAFRRGAQRLVVVGTDSPWMQREDVLEAFTMLERAALVVGPTEDGGYYLIGLSRPVPAVFEGVAWGSPHVYTQTQEKARALGLRVETLRRGYDLDHLEDVRRFVETERRRGHVPTAVHTIIRLLSEVERGGNHA
jgi:rSAM/selenodomain-associated transferase 1